MSKPIEHILCAAVHHENDKRYIHQPHNIFLGIVVTGYRRQHSIENLERITGIIGPAHIKGFLTSENRFVDRKEAYTIAFNANQIIGPNKGIPTNDIGLTSEDLY